MTDAVGSTAATWDAETGGFTYDANGNLLTAPAPYGVTAAVYDHRNLPLLLTANGVTSAYRYDGQGQRISKRVTGSNLDEFYILDGRTSLGVVTVDGAGAVVSWTWNVLAGDKVVGRETQTAQRLYYHTDLLGTTRVVVQGATIVEAYDYDPWGVRLEGRILAGPTKEGFTTKERDAETGLDYFGARYYMAALGRWTSVDPLADQFPEWTAYNYVKNNPGSLTDPFGLCPPADENFGDCPSSVEARRTDALQRPLFGEDLIVGVLTGGFNLARGLATRIAGRFVGKELVSEAVSSGSGSAVVDDGFAGVRELSQTLRKSGVGREDRLKVVNSFQEGTITGRTATGNESFVRFFGGGAGAEGRFLTPSFPSSGTARAALALPPENTANALRVFQLAPGTRFFEGAVAPQFGQPGGGLQIFVPLLSALR